MVKNPFAAVASEAAATTAASRAAPAMRALSQFNVSATLTTTVPGAYVACKYAAMKVSSASNPCQVVQSADTSGATISTFACKTGHSGRLCASCQDGYFSQNGECIKCSQSSGVWPSVVIFFTLIVIGAVSGAAIMRNVVPQPVRDWQRMWSHRWCVGGKAEEQMSESSLCVAKGEGTAKLRCKAFLRYIQQLIQVVISFFQTLTIVVADLSLPDAVLPTLAIFQFAQPSSEGIGMECISEFGSFESRFRAMVALPPVVVLMLLAAFSIEFVIKYAGVGSAEHAEHDEKSSDEYTWDSGESCSSSAVSITSESASESEQAESEQRLMRKAIAMMRPRLSSPSFWLWACTRSSSWPLPFAYPPTECLSRSPGTSPERGHR